MKVVDSSKRSERSWWTPVYNVGALGVVLVARAVVLIVGGTTDSGIDVPGWVGVLAYGAGGWLVDVHEPTAAIRRHRTVSVDGAPVSLRARNLRSAARYEFTFGSDPAHRAAISHVPSNRLGFGRKVLEMEVDGERLARL